MASVTEWGEKRWVWKRALSGVDEHDGVVGRGERAVGVLGEVSVAGRVLWETWQRERGSQFVRLTGQRFECSSQRRRGLGSCERARRLRVKPL